MRGGSFNRTGGSDTASSPGDERVLGLMTGRSLLSFRLLIVLRGRKVEYWSTGCDMAS